MDASIKMILFILTEFIVVITVTFYCKNIVMTRGSGR